MKKETILSSLRSLRESSKKRGFSQALDIIINLKGIDVKKPDQRVDSFIVLPSGLGKKVKVCGLIDKELVLQAKDTLDKVITKEQFSTLKKQEIKHLANNFDFFIAQSTLMVEIAKYFGKILGSHGRMPNPKSGCVIPPNANLKTLYEKLQKTVRMHTKTEPSIKCLIGKESLSDEELAANILSVYDTLIKLLPNEKSNIGKIYIKFTMSAPLEVKDE